MLVVATEGSLMIMGSFPLLVLPLPDRDATIKQVLGEEDIWMAGNMLPTQNVCHPKMSFTLDHLTKTTNDHATMTHVPATMLMTLPSMLWVAVEDVGELYPPG